MSLIFPVRTVTAVRLNQVFRVNEKDKRLLSERMSSRMVRCASVLQSEDYLGWQATIPVKGLVNIAVFGSADLGAGDLEWIAEKTARTAKCGLNGRTDQSLSDLYELYLPVAEKYQSGSAIGFGVTTEYREDGFCKWPSYYSSQFSEMVRVLRKTGGILRITVGPASEEEQETCRKNVLRTYDTNNVNDYIGRPVRMRVLLRIPGEPSVRLRTVLSEAVPGMKLRFIGKMGDQVATDMWEDPIDGAAVLPDYAARILALEPEIYEPVIGIELSEEEMKKIPAGHKKARDKRAVVIGKADDTAGFRRNITIGELDLRRHYQIVGQTGTGKSTLLATMILSAVKQGHGLTFFDPHGSTIDVVLRTIPEEYAHKIRVVRIGDADNPVPLNIWDSDDPIREERNISDLCELFGDLFNPPGEVYVGPRYERWLSTFAKASIAFLGRRASLESIAVISQSQDNMLKVSKAIISRYPELVETIKF